MTVASWHTGLASDTLASPVGTPPVSGTGGDQRLHRRMVHCPNGYNQVSTMAH
jgi:hypothetical protein